VFVTAPGRDVTRLFASGVALSLGLAAAMPRCAAADGYGGSLGVTSDYIVRGVSRSNDHPALQLDVHYMNSSGLVAGLFASNTQIDPDESKDVELGAFLGYAWISSGDWHGKILLSHYAYPWNYAGGGYDYDEFDADSTFRDWLKVSLVYSPNYPRYVQPRGLISTTAQSAELSVRRPLARRLSAAASAGYSHFGGPQAGSLGYWGGGVTYDLSPVALTLSYVNTSAGAKALFYNSAESNRWTATVIWRF
jgi:uncharacterized protein (TIGR02001 family)